ncbi:MAG: J domain-containing protein [Actinobacteria bacterium]|jgi:hypothetical protein|nr:J domain-containing protein [Actinomycetota bacterium]
MRSAMDRAEAARLLGVDPACSPRQADKAFKALVRERHPDRYPPGSEAWEDASALMPLLTEARRVLGSPSAPPPPERPAPPTGVRVAGVREEGDAWAWRDEAPPVPEGRFLTPRQVDRRTRAWGYGWGGFLLVSALVSFLVGASQPVNDALPFWSPALAITGAIAVVLGWRADRRLRTAG